LRDQETPDVTRVACHVREKRHLGWGVIWISKASRQGIGGGGAWVLRKNSGLKRGEGVKEGRKKMTCFLSNL